MGTLDRRDFLRLGGAGLACCALTPVVGNPFLGLELHAASFGGPPKKLLIVFLRGGNDGVNTVIPYGDVEYNVTNRPTLYVPPALAHDLNGHCSLHPSMGLMKDVFLTGDLAVMHRIAYQNQSRSHFSSQQYWENAMPTVPGADEIEEGWINRLIDSDPALANHVIPAVSISNNMQVVMRGERALIHMRNIDSYRLGTDPIDLKMIGAAPSGGGTGSGLLGVYSRDPDATDYDPLLRETGVAMASSLDALVVAGIDEFAYVPENGAFYPATGNTDGFDSRLLTFFRQVKNAVQLLKQSDCRVAAVELGSFDTHSNQGISGAGSSQSENLRGLSRAFHSIRLDTLNNIWSDTLVLAVSEFGRTSEENGSDGTDHGEASCVFCAGGDVVGGVYNCDAATWPNGTMLSTPNGRYVAQLTSFLSVYAEIISRHFDAASALNTVIPGWSGFTGSQYNFLNFLPP
jgi:uncharacterized protein (DUF1501 family)